MGEFENVARRIAAEISAKMQSREKIDPSEIAEILGLGVGQINCYPGIPSGRCCDLAFFVSLKNKNYATGRGHLDFGAAVSLLVKHMQGGCADVTRNAVIITDSWDDAAYGEWRANVQNIKQSRLVEAYLITGGKVTQVNT